MNTNNFNDTQVSIPTDSRGKNAFDNRPQSAFLNRQSSKFDFKKPRFSERNSYPRVPLSVNRSKLAIPYKSELCLLFQKGKCYYGENCHFAHKMSEIRKPGSKTVAMEEHLNDDSKRNAMRRVKECHFFTSGVDCPYGDKCLFLHKCDRNAISFVNGERYRSGSDQIEFRSSNAGEDYDNLGFRKRKNCIYGHGKADHQGLGSFAEVGNGRASRFMLDSQRNDAVSCEARIKIAKKMQMLGKRCFIQWDVEKISQIYADCLDS